MKSNKLLSIALCSLLMLMCKLSFAQESNQYCENAPPCIANSTLNNASSAAGGNMNSSPALTVPDWYVSSGSPSFFSDVPVGGGVNSVWMWSYSGRGEGIYTCFNFVQNRRYRVCFWVRNTNTQNVGNLIVRAANGLTQDFSTFSPNISPSSAQLISNTFTHSPTWTFETYEFVANANYSQLQIMPYRTLFASSPAEQYELAVDLVSVLEIPSEDGLPTDIIAQCGTNVDVHSNVTQPCVNVEWFGPSSFYATGTSMHIANINSSHSGTYEMRISTPFGCTYSHLFNITVVGDCDDPICEQPPSCIINGHLTALGSGDLNTSPTSTVNGWYVSHGTPTVMLEGTPGHAPTVVWMWSYSSTGEGIFTCYRFERGKRYRVCLDVRNTNQQTVGNLLVRAANNLVVGSPANIFPASMQLISSSYTYSSSWTTVTYDFIADNNYNFLQILPFRTGGASSPAEQYELMVDNISVIEAFELPPVVEVECGHDLIYDLAANPCYTYEWHGPSGFYSSSPGLFIPNVNYTHSGTYTLNIIGNTGNCMYETSFHVEVVGDCLSCDEATLEIEVGGCNPVYFNPISNASSSIVNYYWTFGDGNTSTLANPVKYYSSAGVYEVCLTVTFNLNGQICCKTVCILIDVCDPQPDQGGPQRSYIDFDYEYFNEQEIKINSIQVDKHFVIEDVLWLLDDVHVSKTYNPFLDVSNSTEICLEAFIANSQNVQENVRICKPLKDSKKGHTSLKDFEVYPNPTDGVFYIKDPQMEIRKIELYNSTGQSLLQVIPEGTTSGSHELNISKLPGGVYMIRLITERESVSKRIVLH